MPHFADRTTVQDPPNTRPPKFPVAIKGVCIREGRVLLLRNERSEWELPGGKLELGETPQACLAREIHEETGWPVQVEAIIDCWPYHIFEGVDVVVVTYGCTVLSADAPTLSQEHQDIRLFELAEVPDLPMPDGYKNSIAAWA